MEYEITQVSFLSRVTIWRNQVQTVRNFLYSTDIQFLLFMTGELQICRYSRDKP